MIRDDLAAALADAVGALGIDVSVDSIELERPAQRQHGDWSSNIAMVHAKKNDRIPRTLAGEIAESLNDDLPTHVESVEVAGPGFVNFRLHDTWLYDVLTATVEAGVDGFGRSNVGAGTHVNVEFVSANPNKPLHAGHARGACYGDSVARLLEAVGYRVTREFYLNDRGVQMNRFAESLAARKRGEKPAEDGYQGEYLVEWAHEMPDSVTGDAEVLEWGYARALRSHRDTLGRINVVHDVWFSERSLVSDGRLEQTLGELSATGQVFEADGATWLRTTEAGDDKDRVLIKADGEYTYITPDIAYHRDKLSRSDHLINVWGADHHGYIARMKAAIGFLDGDPDKLEVIITQMVNLLKDGQPFRQAGRLGDMVALDDVIDAVGPDAARFSFLMQSMDSSQTVDLDELATKSMDNPAHYPRYGTARIHQLGANAEAAGHSRAPLAEVDLGVLIHERELEILRTLSGYAATVEIAARERAPHKIATWLRELASAFHGFYSDRDCYVVGDGVCAERTQARLWLVEAARIGLTAGLDLLGVSAPQEM